VHENDAPLTMHPWRYDHERSRALHLAMHPGGLPYVATFARNRAFLPRAIREIVRFQHGTLPVPGSPRVIPTPGHTRTVLAPVAAMPSSVARLRSLSAVAAREMSRGPRRPVSRGATAPNCWSPVHGAQGPPEGQASSARALPESCRRTSPSGRPAASRRGRTERGMCA
jgi:hypothetical protein